MRRASRFRVVVTASVLVAATSGCQAIAGIEELRLRDDSGATDGTVGDAPPDDARDDTTARPDSAIATDGDAAKDSVVVTDAEVGIDSTTVADTSDAALSDTALPDTAPPPCPTTGQAMTRITYTGGTFCIDGNEVTASQMRTFASSGYAAPASRPLACGTIPVWYDDPAARTDDPAYNVKWCSAWAYCNWAGKRLCGRLDTTTAATGTNSEYAWTCANGAAAYPYPYGATFSSTACDAEAGRSTPDLVTSHPACHGATAPYSSVYNLSGGVAEWTDDCPDASHCWVRGGYFGDLRTNATCTSLFALPITVEQAGNGFRCCK